MVLDVNEPNMHNIKLLNVGTYSKLLLTGYLNIICMCSIKMFKDEFIIFVSDNILFVNCGILIL